MKRQIIQPVTAASASAGNAARKVLQSLRKLRNDLDDLYMVDEDLYDELDLESVHDEVNSATMFVAHVLEGN